MDDWWTSPYTGIVSAHEEARLRAHDPDIAVCTGLLVPWGPRRDSLPVGGAAFASGAARDACAGEAIERLHPCALPTDSFLEASAAAWPLDEPPVPPEAWVLFHAEQYATPGFPFEPFTAASHCRWTCFRHAPDGTPRWVPHDMAFLYPEPGRPHRFGPGVSTGWAAGRTGDPVLLRGLQEVLERDAAIGAWWGRYPLEACDPGEALAAFDPDERLRLLRPNLGYRFHRIRSPFTALATIVTLEGEDREGWCFSAGSACRESRRASWRKATIEAVHGRHYVRYLVGRDPTPPAGEPRDFGEHAAWYTRRPGDLGRTVFARATAAGRDDDCDAVETLSRLAERLGPQRPVLFRNATPAALARANVGWHVLRVLVPGLQPLHGDHRLPHLGGPLWSPRGVADYRDIPPHPFP